MSFERVDVTRAPEQAFLVEYVSAIETVNSLELEPRIAIERLGDIMNALTEPWALIPSSVIAGEGKVVIRKLAFGFRQDTPLLYVYCASTKA